MCTCVCLYVNVSTDMHVSRRPTSVLACCAVKDRLCACSPCSMPGYPSHELAECLLPVRTLRLQAQAVSAGFTSVFPAGPSPKPCKNTPVNIRLPLPFGTDSVKAWDSCVFIHSCSNRMCLGPIIKPENIFSLTH